MSNVLSIQFSFPVPELLSFVKLMFLDVRNLVRLDCWDIGGFYGKLITNIMVMPVLFVIGCALLYMNQRRTISAVIAAGGSDESAFTTATVAFKSNLLFGVFLLYPTITATLFRVPQCLELNGEHSFHEEDFTIDCNSGSYLLALTFTALCILLVPIGVPSIFLFFSKQASDSLCLARFCPGVSDAAMQQTDRESRVFSVKRARDALGGANQTVLGGAKLVSDEIDDESDHFGYLCKDCKPEFY